MMWRAIAFAWCCAVFTACATHSDAHEGSNSAAPAVPVAVARYGTFIVHIPAQGRVGTPAGGEARLAFAQPGIIGSIDVHVGERVHAGEPLASLDTRGFALDLAQARDDAQAAGDAYGAGTVPALAVASDTAKVAAARERAAALARGSAGSQSDARAARDALRQSLEKIAVDRTALAREQTLFTGGVAAKKDVDAAGQQLALDEADADADRAQVRAALTAVADARMQARADVTQAQSELRTAQAQAGVTGSQAASAQTKVATAQRNLSAATIFAPRDGVVTSILKAVGEATDTTQPAIVVGPASARVATLTVVGVAARDIRPGAPVELIGRDGARAIGSVQSGVPSVDPATQTTTVVVDGVPPGAAPGDALSASIAVSRRRGIVVPSPSLVEDPQSGKTVVFVRKRDGSFEERTVAVLAGDDRTSVVTGVTAGERVASEGAFDLLAPAGGG